MAIISRFQLKKTNAIMANFFFNSKVTRGNHYLERSSSIEADDWPEQVSSPTPTPIPISVSPFFAPSPLPNTEGGLSIKSKRVVDDKKEIPSPLAVSNSHGQFYREHSVSINDHVIEQEVDNSSPLRQRTTLYPQSEAVLSENHGTTIEESERGNDDGPISNIFNRFFYSLDNVAQSAFQIATDFDRHCEEHSAFIDEIYASTEEEISILKKRKHHTMEAVEKLRSAILQQSAGTDADNEKD